MKILFNIIAVSKDFKFLKYGYLESSVSPKRFSTRTDLRMALLCTNKKLVTFLFWTPKKANYVSKWSDFQEKLIDSWHHYHQQFLSKFEENNENDKACFLGCFLFQLMAEPNRPNSWFWQCCHSTPILFSMVFYIY